MTPLNIVFDFGAVLFNWQPHELVQRSLPAHAGTEAVARRLAVDMFHHDDWQAFDRGTVESGWVTARIAERLALPLAQVEALVAAIPAHLEPIRPTLDLLARLRQRRAERGDLRLYFLSNMPAPFARHLEARHAFLRDFDGGLFSGDVKLIKPEPAIFALLGERHGLEPARTVFIDDLAANVAAAQAFGWHALQFHDAARLEPLLQPHLG